jgi:hypothetical protein
MLFKKFRDKPEMVEWRKNELIGLKRSEISGYPLMAEAY